MRLPRVLLLGSLLLLMFSLPGWPARNVQGLSQPVSTVQISPVSTCCLVNGFFTVDVMLILPSGESINGFDVRINYTNAFTNVNPGVLQAKTIRYSDNLFASYAGTVFIECIDGTAIQGSTGCPSEDAPLGQFHLSEIITGPELVGPVTGRLFSVTFQVTGAGTSVFTIDRANLVNPHPDPSNPQLINPVLIPVVKQDGVFGNQGVVAFFNYHAPDPSVTPSIIPNQQVVFDAGASFAGNGSPVSFRLYSWDFGDGSAVSNVVTGATNTHSFRAPGNYTVSLTVWDTKNETGSVARKVVVLPALGNLALIVKNQIGTVMRGNVNVRVFNSSSFSNPFITKTVGAGGDVQFNGLTPGSSYYLTFSGDTVDSYSKTELIEPGLTTYDTVYMTEKSPPPDYSGLIYLGTTLGGVGIVSAAIVYKMRSRREDPSHRSRRKSRIRK